MIPVHVPVMPETVLEYLAPKGDGGFIIDGTLGEGGHAEVFLKNCRKARVLGVDADSIMGQRAAKRLSQWEDRFEWRHAWTDDLLSNWTGPPPDVVLMDLGISTYHYNESGRGFSFRTEEVLDMRLNPDGEEDASKLLNNLNERDLAHLIYTYGEERFSRRIARRIVEERSRSPIADSARLARIVVSALPPKARHRRIHAATQTFQALRIGVNRELDRLERLLKVVPGILAPGGRFGVISFHSLEDRLVKQAFRQLDARYGGDYEVLTRKPLRATEEECRENPPSRTAKFRVISNKTGGQRP